MGKIVVGRSPPCKAVYRPKLINLCHLALEYYSNLKEGLGASFEFHDLVKCCFGCDFNDGTDYYITFQAKPNGGDSSQITTTFQAKVLVDRVDKDKPPVVKECRIKI
ncbi:hypothetical protein TSUD_181480 [Trifolium subterraneum]|uniref:Cystatin domain-containing protein n=1 Tax=Trifolium subterraneum TaxID=3900 RepID=A0A2Z6NL99_TRISU|nr:hypothetical protein TSUD_181480 [Trifolium subterraneum]